MKTPSNYTSQVNTLKQRETELHFKLETLREQISALEALILQLDKTQILYAEAKNSAENLQTRYCELRRDSQNILDELLHARMMLSTTKMETEAIASERSDCGYA